MHRPTLISIISLSAHYLADTCSAQEPTPTPEVLEVSMTVSSSESETTDGNMTENNITESTSFATSECLTGDPELLSASTSDLVSEDPSTSEMIVPPYPTSCLDPLTPIPWDELPTATPTSNHTRLTPNEPPTPTSWTLDESIILMSPNLHNGETASPTRPQTFIPGLSTSPPTSTQMSIMSVMQTAAPIPGTARGHVTTVVGAPITGNRPTPMTNTPPSGVYNPTDTPENTLQSSGGVAENTPQGQSGDRFTLTLVSVGTSTTLSIVTEITLGIDAWTTPGTSMMSGTQPSIGPVITPGNVPNNNIVRGRLPPAAIGAIVGSLLGALTVWILLVVWLKKRKKAQDFRQLEDTWLHKSSPETNGITPFVPPAPKPNNTFNPDSKRRFRQEMPQAASPVTSIGDTGIHSEFLSMPITGSLSEDLYPVASSSDPFKRLSESQRDRKGTQPGGSGY
ncbi:hypothetical protein CPB86DRAFT_786826 [Serendipita vermifera]|nr:hypothetical protein CPB86DRAFT_786826 [Serendipita vermifera]